MYILLELSCRVPCETHKMDTEMAANIDADAFMPSKKSQPKAGKKRTISSTAAGHDHDDQQMQVDETTGIEGGRKSHAPKTKRKKHTAVELRKIAVPSHRLVPSAAPHYSQLLRIGHL